MSILDPLAARYATWLSLPPEATNDTAGEDPENVRAMPVVLRIDRDPLPARTPLLEAAAAAAIAVCLDPRAEPEGPWHEEVDTWVRGRIRKVSRRARGAHWAAVQELPGVTVEVDGAAARALVPGRVAAAPREVSRLQISGSELPDDEPGPVPADTPVLWCNPHVPMTAGKAAAQVGHATMLLAALLHASGQHDRLRAWSTRDFRCAVRTPTAERWAALHPGADPDLAWRTHTVVAVRDAGFTEVAPGTVTILAQWP
ncbi:peptidyl-tRNA hydrolase [Actinokineospora iranica]|uniref:peptidyl-tRNA hydrolase n=1 Tax=Actinokineospora iranica TaxID=1271860 RepID=A0A1G6X1M8_9PSEU|nr:peptidyl-tRNA hydrolase [Actinokineospora iranica]SDD72001.1 Peptidyl-tRNA hydrolase [Actinokineospora iranica]